MLTFPSAGRFLLLLMALSGCWGCSSQPAATSTSAGTPQAREGLEDLARLLSTINAQGGALPRTAADFAQHDVAFPAAGVLVQNGTITYLPRATLDPAATPPYLVAMQADADTTGGWVLLSNGEVQDLPAAEVAALPRPPT